MKFNILLCFFFFSLNCFTQTKHQFELNYKWNDADFFSGLTYKPLFSKKDGQTKRISIEPFVSLQTGIIRTFFQKRLYPSVSLGSTFYFLENRYFSFGSRLSTDYMVLKINRNSNDFQHRTQYLIGYQLKLGKNNLYFTQHTAVGLKHEYWKNSIVDSYQKHKGMVMELNVGLLYVMKTNELK